MSEPRIIHRFRKGKRSEVRASLSHYRGELRADIRLWVPGDGDEELVPTKSGTSLPVDYLGNLLQTVQALVGAASTERKRA
jgi:Transcriptional Coactivator p15 (PC4)